MKTTLLIGITLFAILPGCSSSPSEEVRTREYNVCVVVDGTDRLTNENSIPIITADEILNFAKSLSNNGSCGNLYLSYIDSDCDNNIVGVYEWLDNEPVKPGDKPLYVKMSDYQKLTEKYSKDSLDYARKRGEGLQTFYNESKEICQLAYSEDVARRKSDINGSINKAYRLLRASSSKSNRSIIVLISDGVDNIGKPLDPPIESETEVLIVNSNPNKSTIKEIISKEFVTFNQVEKYILR